MRTIHTEKYYTSTEYLLKVFEQNSRKMGLSAESITEYEEWKKNTRIKLSDITGISKMEKCDLCPQLLETEQLDGYKRDKMIIQTEPGVWMTFYVLVPDHMETGIKKSCMIAPHGHGSAGNIHLREEEISLLLVMQ